MITYANPNQPDPRPLLPSREATSNQQVGTVLMIMRELQPYLLSDVVNIDTGNRPELDGGASCAALSTFVKACDRLDRMLNDMSRWDLKENDDLYHAMTEQFKAATKVHENQVEAVKRIQSPAVRLKPSLTTIGNEFIAFLVTSDLPGGTIIGKGRTPQLALDDFNGAWHRVVEEQLKFAAESEAIINAEAVPEVENKKKKRKPKGY